jgi:hypothetical protein
MAGGREKLGEVVLGGVLFSAVWRLRSAVPPSFTATVTNEGAAEFSKLETGALKPAYRRGVRSSHFEGVI